MLCSKVHRPPAQLSGPPVQNMLTWEQCPHNHQHFSDECEDCTTCVLGKVISKTSMNSEMSWVWHFYNYYKHLKEEIWFLSLAPFQITILWLTSPTASDTALWNPFAALGYPWDGRLKHAQLTLVNHVQLTFVKHLIKHWNKLPSLFSNTLWEQIFSWFNGIGLSIIPLATHC